MFSQIFFVENRFVQSINLSIKLLSCLDKFDDYMQINCADPFLKAQFTISPNRLSHILSLR